MELVELVPGFYEHTGANHLFLKVHFTDYEYAVVETCDGGTFSTCVHKQVEIWSRTMDPIPLHIKTTLEDVVSGNLCIPVDDLHELEAGNCNAPEITIPDLMSHRKKTSWSLGSLLRKIF
uniref:Uncharacterized protein n=1 Tax=Pinctada fucata TaxID=50426 RepID=A0A194ANA1_PINFU